MHKTGAMPSPFGCWAVGLFGCLAVGLFGCLAIWLFGSWAVGLKAYNERYAGPEEILILCTVSNI